MIMVITTMRMGMINTMRISGDDHRRRRSRRTQGKA
jgi:hypothetical protein